MGSEEGWRQVELKRGLANGLEESEDSLFSSYESVLTLRPKQNIYTLSVAWIDLHGSALHVVVPHAPGWLWGQGTVSYNPG
ncbi:hypothetical protein BHE74_00040238 [Ensete ventricosum]|nr:hypothetical protein BHE74_00040238 [Ensete ventricosum]